MFDSIFVLIPCSECTIIIADTTESLVETEGRKFSIKADGANSSDPYAPFLNTEPPAGPLKDPIFTGGPLPMKGSKFYNKIAVA